MTIVFQYLTFLWTLSTLWNVSWILTTSCALIFTVFCLLIEVLLFRTLCLLVAVFNVAAAVGRVLLVFAPFLTRSVLTDPSCFIEVLSCVTPFFFYFMIFAYCVSIAINLDCLPFVTSVCRKNLGVITSSFFRVIAYPLSGTEFLTFRTIHSYIASVMTHEVTRAARVVPCRRSFLNALSVRAACWRQQTLRSCRVIVFAACLHWPDAVEVNGTEVCCWRTSSADGSSATVTLDVIMTVSGMGEVVQLVVLGVLRTHGFRTWWTRKYRAPSPAVSASNEE